MTTDAVSRSTGADRVVAVEGAGADVAVTVPDRTGATLMAREVIPVGGRMTVLTDRPPGPRAAAEGVTVEVSRNGGGWWSVRRTRPSGWTT